MKGIHISDLHLHTHNEDNQKSIELLKRIKKDYPGHHLIITGDITDDGHKDQYENAIRLVNHKAFICPGNHDYGIAGNFYDSYREALFNEYLHFERSVICDGVLLIALDSNLKTPEPWDFAGGEIGVEQLRWLSATLTNAPPIPRIVYMHHHPFMHGHPFMELKDARGLMRILYNRVDLLLFGHKHEEAYWKDTCGIKQIHASGNPPSFWEFEI